MTPSEGEGFTEKKGAGQSAGDCPAPFSAALTISSILPIAGSARPFTPLGKDKLLQICSMTVFYRSGFILFENELIHIKTIQRGNGDRVMDHIRQLVPQLTLQVFTAMGFSSRSFIENFGNLADLFHKLHK